jgi:hypothetical protein
VDGRTRRYRCAGIQGLGHHFRYGCSHPADRIPAPVELSWSGRHQEAHSVDSGDPSWTNCLTDLDARTDLNDLPLGDQNHPVDLHRKTAVPSRRVHRSPTLGHPSGAGPNYRFDPVRLKTVMADRILPNSLVAGPRSRNRHPWTHRYVPTQRRDADQGPRIPAGAENQKDCVVP